MNILNTWWLWTIVYLISAVVFAYNFKIANKNMKDPGALTILLEVITGIFSLLMIPLFDIKFKINTSILLTLLIVVCIYAITDRLNTEARYGLETSTFSMVKRLSTVFMIIFGFLFLKEPIIPNKILGAAIIIIGNVILTYNKGKFEVNKYLLMAIISQFLFAIAMVINVDLSDHFNLAFYTWITVTIPALLITIVGRHKPKDIIKEFNRYNKPRFLIAAFSWALMLNSSIRAYQLGSITIVAALLSLTPILNSLVELIFNKDTNKIIQKIIVSILLILGVILVNL
ncbi:MAG: EamA family transporter [Bacilli bacterium]|nr:EamA family transporter [Bacilli bacterium]